MTDADQIDLAKSCNRDPQWAAAHALIAIAQELRRLNEHNDHFANGPRG